MRVNSEWRGNGESGEKVDGEWRKSGGRMEREWRENRDSGEKV